MKLAFHPFVYGILATPDYRYAIASRLQHAGYRFIAQHVPEAGTRVKQLGSFKTRKEAEAACQAHADEQQVAA